MSITIVFSYLCCLLILFVLSALCVLYCLFLRFVASKSYVGVNKMAEFGKDVARSLNLENCDAFTGHTFRRSGMQILAVAGLSIEQLKADSG